MTTYWRCIPCAWTSNTGAFCANCGRRREDATDEARWEKFFTVDAEIVAATWSQPTPECPECGHLNHDPEHGRCTVIWMGERCSCGECPHEHVLKDDDGRDNWFYVCDDCDAVVVLTEPDEDGKSYWEVVE